MYMLTGWDKSQLCQWYDHRTEAGALKWMSDILVGKSLPDVSELTEALQEKFMADLEAVKLALPPGSGYVQGLDSLRACILIARSETNFGQDWKRFYNDNYAECVSRIPHFGKEFPTRGIMRGLIPNANYSLKA